MNDSASEAPRLNETLTARLERELADAEAAEKAGTMTGVEAKAAASAALARYDRDIYFGQLERDFPGWHCWEGVIAGMLYARLPMSSPPLVVRSITLSGLREEIELAERGIR